MTLLLIHGTLKRSLEMKTVMRFTKGKEKIIKNKPINSTDEGKGRHRKVIRIGAFALVFVVLFSFVSTFFKMTDAVNIATIEGFYKEPKNTIDVMMIGASEVYADYSATEAWKNYGYTSYSLGVSGVPGSLYKSMLREALTRQHPKVVVFVMMIGASEVYADYSATEAWKNYGYTSYSLGVSGVPGSLYKSMLREALTRQHPKVVVFEVNGFLQNDSYYDRTVKLHSWIDNIHNEENRLDTIQEIVPKDEQDNFRNPLKLYHSNWKDIDKCAHTFATRVGMYFAKTSCMKGFSSIAKYSDCPSGKQKKLYFTDKSRAYMTDLLEYCKAQGVEKVLFARFPHEKEIKNPQVLCDVKELVESYGYDFASFEGDKELIGINERDDFYNSEHLNINGSRKFTAFMGKYLSDNYRLNADHSPEIQSAWGECARRADKVISACAKDTDLSLGNHYFEMSVYLPYNFSSSLATNKVADTNNDAKPAKELNTPVKK